MSELSHRRFAALGGLVFVVLDVVALFLPGPPPKASESAQHIAATLASHRTQVLVGMYAAGLAMVALLLFLASIRSWLVQARGDDGLTIAAIGGALVGIGSQLVGLLFFYGAAFKVAGQHQDALVRALTDAGNAGVELGKFGFAAFIVGVCLAGRRSLAATMFWTGLASAALLIVSAMSLFSTGAVTQFGSGLDVAGAAPAIAWVVLFSVVVLPHRVRAGPEDEVQVVPVAAA